MALDPIMHGNREPRALDELEVLAANASPELLDAARRRERNQISCSNNFLFTQRGPDLARYEALGNGARPSSWAIIAVIEDQTP